MPAGTRARAAGPPARSCSESPRSGRTQWSPSGWPPTTAGCAGRSPAVWCGSCPPPLRRSGTSAGLRSSSAWPGREPAVPSASCSACPARRSPGPSPSAAPPPRRCAPRPCRPSSSRAARTWPAHPPAPPASAHAPAPARLAYAPGVRPSPFPRRASRRWSSLPRPCSASASAWASWSWRRMPGRGQLLVLPGRPQRGLQPQPSSSREGSFPSE
mmetsp:Transcript_20655/g.46609  ORF Transcript_20655/g.46609 Transcript_20655/m.46609 type:complete len:214 (+) Transcript_20655:1628-2269(+)